MTIALVTRVWDDGTYTHDAHVVYADGSTENQHDIDDIRRTQIATQTAHVLGTPEHDVFDAGTHTVERWLWM